MVDPPTPSPDDATHRRRLKFRQRDDYAVELFKEAREHLDDAARVDRILIMLGRFYNPYVKLVEWHDVVGIDSEYDYDPVWQRCRELRIAPSFHNGARSCSRTPCASGAR